MPFLISLPLLAKRASVFEGGAIRWPGCNCPGYDYIFILCSKVLKPLKRRGVFELHDAPRADQGNTTIVAQALVKTPRPALVGHDEI
jgi:hypothetical protein